LTTGDPGLVRSIVSLAEALGLPTIAEGVENAGQLEALAALDCDLTQGFYIGYPQAPDKIDALLNNQPPGPHDPATNDGRNAIGTAKSLFRQAGTVELIAKGFLVIRRGR
jgi:predicted signal transduction protein with EAL and GGDEF domain